MIDIVLLIGMLIYLIWHTYSLGKDIQTIRDLEARIAELEARQVEV